MALSRSTVRAVATARLHLRTGNPDAYARSLAGEHRLQTERQQRAIEAVIAADPNLEPDDDREADRYV